MDGDWWEILGLPFSATKNDVSKARRRLQLKVRADKGGCTELSALVNLAADSLLAMRLFPSRNYCLWFEALRKRRADGRQLLSEQAVRQQIAAAVTRTARDTAHNDCVKLCHRRSAGHSRELRLSKSTGVAFPSVKKRIHKFRSQGLRLKIRALIYAV